MATTTSPTTESNSNRPVNLLSLDAGGPRGVSQLLILKDVMEKLSKDESGDSQGTVKRACEVFNMIGGVGTGGLIAIFLAVLKMTADEALEEFSNFAVEVYQDVLPNPTKQTDKLTRTINGILERHGISKNAKLIPTSESTPACKLVVPVMYKNHVGTPCILRNHPAGHESPVDPTIFEAMLATCSTPPIFTSTTISKDFSTFEYVSGDIGLSNPTREVIAEAHRAFGDERTVSCLISIGCGHPGVKAVPTASSTSAWVNFVERVAMDSEKTAQDLGTQMSRLTLYHRLSVKRGLEENRPQGWTDPNFSTAHTTTYLDDLEVIELVNRCVGVIEHGDGFTTLEQLKHSGTEVLSPPLPPLTRNYVERKHPMEFIEMSLFEEDGMIKSGSKAIVVTGIGGCGKTQLIRRFIEKHNHLFASTFFIDGSSPDTIRRDIVRHVRALGGAHSQKSFEECMLFLSQTLQNGERLVIIDNVDEPTLDLSPFLPRWQNGVIMVTSRNHSRGQLSAAGHLQLDVMTLEEASELLVRGSGKQWPPPETDRILAVSVAGELGCHPIALVQAISYMYSTGSSPRSYVALLRTNRDRMLRDNPATSQVDMRYKTAFAAFDASYSILPRKAQHFWHLLSFFRPQNFPLELITLAAQDEFSTQRYRYLTRGNEFELGKDCLKGIFYNLDQWDVPALNSILATLQSHSLIITTPAENTTLLQMHPLVHQWGRLRVSEGDHPRFEAAAVRLLCCGATEDNYTMMQYLSVHVKAVCPEWESLHANDAASFGFIFKESGMYEKYAKLNGIAHEMVKLELGPDHHETITTASNLAVAYHHLGRYAEAAELKAQVLQGRQHLLGVDDPDTIHASAELAATYQMLGRYAEAEELKTEVLRRRKQLLGLDHPDTIDASASLATTYHALGRYAEAEELKTEVLRRRKQLLGLEHPETIQASAELAVTYHELGCYAEAAELKALALQQRNQLLGPDHPGTIKASAELATSYYALRHYAEAEGLHAAVLKKRTRLLGQRHPDTIHSMLYLAQTYDATQRQSEASSLAKKALQLASGTLGEGHPLSKQISLFLAYLPDETPARVTRSGRYAPYKKRTARKK